MSSPSAIHRGDLVITRDGQITRVLRIKGGYIITTIGTYDRAMLEVVEEERERAHA